MSTKTKSKEKKVKEKSQVLQFNDSDVQALEGLEAVRLRYDMYVGSTEPSSQLFAEALDNSIDEFMNGFGKVIKVDIDTKENRLTVEDEGRGLPHGMNSKLGKPTMEVLFTHLHSGKICA